MSGFADLGLSLSLQQILIDLGYQEPTPIQKESIPLLLSGSDLIGQAQTGTGKTAAFTLPLLQRLKSDSVLQLLILTPTRELAIQVGDAMGRYGGEQVARDVCLVYGGQPLGPQIDALRRGARIVVATPGRLIDHMERSTIDVSNVWAVVLDEADEMLKMGFRDEVEWVLSQLPSERQSILFSATMPQEIEEIGMTHLSDQLERVHIQGEARGSDHVDQGYLFVKSHDRYRALDTLIEQETDGLVIVFVKTKRESTQIADRLQAQGHAVEALNGDLSQNHREAVVSRLKSARLCGVVATDVAARGIDINGVSLVINYDLPNDAETYIHRIGRTGRGGQRGRAILLVSPREVRGLKRLENDLDRKLTPISPPQKSELLESRVTTLRERMVKELEAQDTDGEEELSYYEKLLAQLKEQGHDLEAISIAALCLASSKRALKLSSIPDTIEALEMTSFSQKWSAPLVPKPGCHVIVLHAGRDFGVRPKDIVGAISHEARIDGSLVGAIRIEQRRTLIELPSDKVTTVVERLSGKRICGTQARFSDWDGFAEPKQESHRGGAVRGTPHSHPRNQDRRVKVHRVR